MMGQQQESLHLDSNKAKTTWDMHSQQYHGGQEWLILQNFKEDFSVTTNPLGTPRKALEQAKQALDTCHHYPSANQEPAKSKLARFLSSSSDFSNIHSRILLGNGASELIDLVTRIAPQGPWQPGPSLVQYKEYERAAISNGREILNNHGSKKGKLTCIVNPNNPTGDYMNIEELKKYIETTVANDSVVMIDESMQPWLSPAFRSDSLLSATAWITDMLTTRGIQIYIMHSWTKIWSCTGLRIGSVICPSLQHAEALRKLQVPWSVNVAGLKFIEAVVEDTEYLTKTWKVTTVWRKEILGRLKNLQSKVKRDHEWKFEGVEWCSWIWIDFGCRETADKSVVLARGAGVPVRPGINGYNCPTCVRIAVREEKFVDVLMDCWKDL